MFPEINLKTWFNEECKTAIRNHKQALKLSVNTLVSSQSLQNLSFSVLCLTINSPFLPHINYLKTKTMQSINLVKKILAHTNWGANHSSVLTIYRSVIRSKLDYGSIVYGSARKSYLSILEPVANTALWLSLGAFCTFPIPSLHALTGEPPLSIRCDQLALHFYYRLNGNKKSSLQYNL